VSRETGRDEKQTHVISNTNRCHGVNYQYFELMSNYLVTTRIVELRPCLLVKNPKITVTPEWILCHEDVLVQALLDKAFLPGFASAHAVSALAEIARQTVCLSERQSAEVASNLNRAYTDLQAFLRVNGLGHVEAYIAQAGAAPLTLFYDVEKFRGVQSPLGQWFSSNHLSLHTGVRNGRLPSLWHGLWLYDRRSGSMFGYGHDEQPSDENFVNLYAFFTSIVQPENLGKRDCSFSEMLERGLGSSGYGCASSACRDDKKASKRRGAWRRQGFPSPLRRRAPEDLHGPAKNPAGVLHNTTCKEKTSTKKGCEDPLQVAGRSRLGVAIACVTRQIMNPDKQVIKCLAEATGRCADPVQGLVKDLKETTFAGIRVGRECQLSGEGDGGGKSDKKAPAKSKDDPKPDASKKDAETALKKANAEIEHCKELDAILQKQADDAAAKGKPPPEEWALKKIKLTQQRSDAEAEVAGGEGPQVVQGPSGHEGLPLRHSRLRI
jgi:hypothetical protein